MPRNPYIIDFGEQGIARIIEQDNYDIRLELFKGGDTPVTFEISGIDLLRNLQRGLYYNIRRMEEAETNVFGLKKGKGNDKDSTT